MTFAGRRSRFPGYIPLLFNDLSSLQSGKPSFKVAGTRLTYPPGYVGPRIAADTQGNQQFKRQQTTQALLAVTV